MYQPNYNQAQIEAIARENRMFDHMNLQRPEEIAEELKLLEADLAEAERVKATLPSLQSRLPHLTSKYTLSQSTEDRKALEECNINLEKAVEASTHIGELKQSITYTKASLEHAKGRIRAAVIDGIKSEYEEVYQQYLEDSKALLAQYIQLQEVSRKYHSLTGHELFVRSLNRLCLPHLHPASYSWSDAPTGQMENLEIML